MPIGGACVLGDLVDDGVERLVVACDKCPRVGNYGVASLIEQHGPTCGLPDLLAWLSRNCPRRASMSLDRCGAVFRFDVE